MLTLSLLLPLAVAVDGPRLPNAVYTADRAGTLVSPPFGGAMPYNQPSVVQGHLLLAGNGHFEVWDIAAPARPVLVSTFESTYGVREAESHQIAARKTADGDVQVVTISGKGVDLWDLTDVTNPVQLAEVVLEGIDYGDNAEAVWGVAWQGDTIYVGGTSTGLHVLDASDPTDPLVVARLTVPELGGVSAGPLFALGNLLVVTTPKEHAGVATIDISDPWAPALLDAETPAERSYIGAFYGGSAYLLTPLRAYDVTTDPSDIRLLGAVPTPTVEYASFGDGAAWLGAIRPNPGALRIDLADPTEAPLLRRVEGRKDDVAGGFFTDDQFTLPVGNHLVLCDDEIAIGCVVAITDPTPDDVPPEVLWASPSDGQGGLPPATRIALSFSDQIDVRTLDDTSIVVRKAGGATLRGTFGLQHTVVTFTPEAPLEPDAVYEVEVTPGGVTDLGGNAVVRGLQLTFSTGEPVTPPPCAMAPIAPVEVGDEATLAALTDPDVDATWDLGDGTTDTGTTVRHAWPTPGRRTVTLTVARDGVTRRCSTTAIVHRPLPSSPAATASSVVVRDGVAYVVNPDADTVTAVDLASAEVRWEVPVGDHPRTLAWDADGRLWVACQDEDTLFVLDGDGETTDVITLPWGSRPFGVVADAVRGGVLVGLEGRGAVASVDPDGGVALTAVDPSAPMPPPVRGLAVAPDGRVLATRWLSGPDAGEVVVLDGDPLAVTGTIPLAADLTPDDNDRGRGVPNALSSVVVSPDGARAVVVGKKDNTFRGLARDGQALTTQNTVRTLVATIDLDQGADLPDRRVDLDDHEGALAAAYGPLGDVVFVVSRGTSRVDVLDAESGRRLAALQSGLAPEGLALAGDVLVVHEPHIRAVSWYDVGDLLAGTDAATRRLGSVATVAVEPLPADVLLGEQLFHDAATREMSQDGYIACATCHPDGGTDARAWDFTDRGEGVRDTIDLRGKAGMGHGPVHWTANFDEIQDFENDIRLHFGGSGLMADADFEATRDTLGASKAGRSARLDALAAYVATLDRFPRSPFREADGSLTEDAVAGRHLLERLDCLECHGGPTLTDSAEGVRHDVGTIDALAGQRLGGPLDGFDTPTLLGLHATAPYLHDGSAPTLEAVLDVPGHGDAQGLPPRKKAQLVALLLQLEDELPPVEAGCGCASGGIEGGWVALLPLALGLRRARRASGQA